MKRMIIAAVLILAILVSSLLLSAFINRSCDQLETLAEEIMEDAERGVEPSARAEKFVALQDKLFRTLYYTANHHDLTTLKVSYEQMVSYIRDDELAEARAELYELRDALHTLRTTEQITLQNIF